MSKDWPEVRVLILGTTYPSYSKKYKEVACTGGIREDNGEMIRLHPLPVRYLSEGAQPKKFHWVRAHVTKDTSDPRPESFRVGEELVADGAIQADEPEERRRWLENSPHRVQSVEALKDRYTERRTSLGIVVPKAVTRCYLRKKPDSARQEWDEAEKRVFAQYEMFDALKPIDFPEYDFMVDWSCDDSRCEGHSMKILQWGLHELQRKLKRERDPEVEVKVIARMRRELDLDQRAVFFFLGNYRDLPFNFGLMDSYSAPRRTQRELPLA